MRKYLPAILVSSFILLALGGAIFYGLRTPHQTAFSSTTTSGTAAVPTSAVSQQSSVQTQGGSTLGVTNGGDVGAALQGQPSAQGTNSASSGSSSASDPFNPSTFAQYDKYKDGQSGMMADVVVGTGDAVTAASKVTVTYRGWLTNGTLFDESRPDSTGKTQPFTFQVGAHSVIPGWEQDIVGMKVGGRRMFIIPPAVGYGANGQNSIPGNAVLVFDVNLLAAQ